MNVGSLFSGIGGFDLGLERAGMRVSWQCEADEFCRRVLTRHWPGVPCYPDVRELAGATVAPVDVLCGGFPCQDLSIAGKGAGIDGARSGLWGEYARLVGELRPRYVIVENVPALLFRGFGRVLGDLAALGYDAEWDCLPAVAFGAPHRRDRVWLLAYPERRDAESRSGERRGLLSAAGGSRSHDFAGWSGEDGRTRTLADSAGEPCDVRWSAQERGRTDEAQQAGLGGSGMADAEREGLQGVAGVGGSRAGRSSSFASGEDQGLGGVWLTEPDVGRVAHGVPARVDRLRSLGNALVPQIAEWLGTQILDYERGRLAA